ncbi:MAG TPA: GNAT family N-acetyltransferase [Paludibacteraceae bacterium]|jgi:ribosomal protein S18 acetylase RimI-like enzyme|nr:GNAT family N-acetyltransferase [Paludibacteraceae bacterium]HOU69424.1 GNAT family N-acetyltransferase [Paludibacteraceae bacterium]HPH63825.1 GNAT family N-acetyltransferase [Paludibacteraceae bacterium]HQF51150.1 GNAT family N-acetyltransferase [Paludibacteraceae bacterium]HQJ90687.1 GNAT family N-acetyltransferase [Paludibacteraceae bacterium]
MKILKAEKKDLKEILDLQRLAFYSEAQMYEDKNIQPLTQTLDEVVTEYENGIVLKAVDDAGAIIGSVRAHVEDGTVHIGKLMTQPSLQGKGIGSSLLLEVENYFPHKRYELFTSNRSIRSVHLYKHLGYEPFKEEKEKEDLTFVYMQKIK